MVPSSRRGKNLQIDAKEEGPGCPKRVSGRHVVRRRQSSPIPAQASSVSVAVRGCARVTGKAGENGQYSGAGRQPTLDKTVGSECGDTLKASASFGLILGGDQGNLAPGSLSTGSPAGRVLLLVKRRDGSVYSQAYVSPMCMVKTLPGRA